MFELHNLYQTTVVKDTSQKIKTLWERQELVAAAYPNLAKPASFRALAENLNNSAQLEQMLAIFTLQGWAQLKVQDPPYSLLQLRLLPSSDQEQALTKVQYILGGSRSGLWAYPHESDIIFSGPTSTVLSRLGLFYGSSCWSDSDHPEATEAPQDRPITPKLLSQLKQYRDEQVTKTLGQNRAALDLILSN